MLTRLVGKIDEAALLASQPQLITVAAGLDPTALGRWVADPIVTHCEPAFEAEAARSRDKRYLQTWRDADGSLRGRFVLPAEEGEALLTALEPLARRAGQDDDRSAGQRRADALTEVCEQVLRHGELPEHGGQRPQLSYVLPADWAAARQSESRCADCGPRCPQHRPRRPRLHATARHVRCAPPDAPCRRRSDGLVQPRPALPPPPRAVAPRQAPPAPPARPVAPGPTRGRPTSRRLGRPARQPAPASLRRRARGAPPDGHAPVGSRSRTRQPDLGAALFRRRPASQTPRGAPSRCRHRTGG